MASFTDLVDVSSAIYSIITFGRERFVAGGARHSIMKVFDLRMPGGKLYYAAKLDACSADTSFVDSAEAPSSSKSTCRNRHHRATNHQNWNVFLNVPRRRNMNHVPDSPVYSLSSPSASSPSWYAGIEGSVIQVDMVSMMDQHPDPVFKYGPEKTGNKNIDVIAKWNPQHDALCLPAYKQTPGSISLIRQRGVGDVRGFKKELDERWQ